MSPAQKALLGRYVEELLRWNARINLTSARTRDDAAQHIADSSAIIAHIPGNSSRLIDVGSGGGLPAVVIAILRDDLQVTALEPVRKKLAFLQHAARALPLPNLVPLPDRVEDHGTHDYDVATSRATFELPRWLEIAHGLVRPGGTILGMEGAEQHVLPPGAVRHPYDLGDRTRAIIVLST